MSPPQFNDGLPVYRKGQQTDGSTESQSREYYMPSPASQGTRITQAPHANHSSAFFTGPINPALMAFTNAHSAHSPQGMMATPPSTTYEGDDIDQFSYRDSPLSAAEALTSSSAHPSVSSPRDWSPIEAQPMTIDEAYRQQYLRNPDPELTFNHPSIAAPGRINQRVYPSNTGAMEQVEASFARATVQDTDHAMSSQSRSNPKSQGNGIQGPSEEGNSARLGQVAEHIGQDRPRGDEPYAQLIYRALMSVERRAMSLQQMYKWFTENTDKPAKSVNTGWQNSIRHNLSMNAAFTNREVEPEAGQGQSRSRSSKPQKEWFLEPWAYGGVQSTTRYRPKGTRRAKASTAENSRANRKGSSRAESGRRGGLTASKSKAKKAGQVQDQRQQQPAYTSDTQGNVQMGGIALATNMDYSYGVHDPMTSQQPMLPAPQSSFAFNPAADNTMAHMPQMTMHHNALAHGAMPHNAMVHNSMPPAAMPVATSQSYSQQPGFDFSQFMQPNNHSSQMYALDEVNNMYSGPPATVPSQAVHETEGYIETEEERQRRFASQSQYQWGHSIPRNPYEH